MDTEIMKPADLSGQVIGNYHITHRLGRGGMADVYKALHVELNVHRAIKFIRPEFVTSEDFRARFQKEAQAVAKLEHPNIVRIHDFGSADNQFYMVMQFVEGQDLKNSLAATGRLPADEAIDLVVAVAGALEYAHKRDLIHRDIKPENIMLGGDGTPILMDFGIAKLLTESTALTQTGVGIGTPAYMAPEQAQGQKILPATDIYALTVVLYELVTGKQPYSADTPIAVMLKAISDPLPLPRSINPDISEELQAVILKGTAKDPAARYQSASEFAADLKSVRGGAQPTVARAAPVAASAGATTVVNELPQAAPTRTQTFVTKMTRMFAWLGATALVLALGAAYWWLSGDDSTAPDAIADSEPAISTRPDSQPQATTPTPKPEAQTIGVGQSTSAPAIAPPTTVQAPVVRGDSAGELFSYRDTLAKAERIETSLELEKGDALYLQLHNADSLTDFKLTAPGARKPLLSSYGNAGPVEVKTTGMHSFTMAVRNKEEAAVDVQLFRINPATIDAGEIEFGNYHSATTQWPGQRHNYQATLSEGDVVYLQLERAESLTDFSLRTLDDRKDIFKSYSSSGPHQIKRSGTHQFFADTRGAKLADYEFILHRLNPAIIQGGQYALNTYAEGTTSQPGQTISYSVELEADDTVFFQLPRSEALTDFKLITPDGRKEVFSSYSHSGPHTLKTGGNYQLLADPRSAKLGDYEFILHRLKPGLIEAGSLPHNEVIANATQQPGQIVQYSVTLDEPAEVAVEVVSSSQLTDFQLITGNGRTKLINSYSSSKTVTVEPGTYQFRADPRGIGVSEFEVLLRVSPTP